MIERVIIAGEGGQGVMFLGKVLAEAACAEGKHVTWLPSYGAEVRGGTANCMVIISDCEIGSPFIDQADALIILNDPSMARFRNRLQKKGLLVVNASLVKQPAVTGAAVESHPFTDTAISLGSARAANMVALGCFVAASKIIDQDSILAVLQAAGPRDRPELIKLNTRAFLDGTRLARQRGAQKG